MAVSMAEIRSRRLAAALLVFDVTLLPVAFPPSPSATVSYSTSTDAEVSGTKASFGGIASVSAKVEQARSSNVVNVTMTGFGPRPIEVHVHTLTKQPGAPTPQAGDAEIIDGPHFDSLKPNANEPWTARFSAVLSPDQATGGLLSIGTGPSLPASSGEIAYYKDQVFVFSEGRFKTSQIPFAEESWPRVEQAFRGLSLGPGNLLGLGPTLAISSGTP